MALARVQYTQSTAGNKNFAVPMPYISKDDIKVSVNGTDVTFTWLNATTVQTTTAPAIGAVVDVRRETTRDVLLVDFQDGSTITEQQLDLSAKQAFYIAQEAFDATGGTLAVANDGSYSANGRRISNLGTPDSDDDAANVGWVKSQYNSGYDAHVEAQNAAASAAAAASSATSANTSKNAAATSATNAASSASAASTSANNAQASATAAASSASNASGSAAAAATSATNAAGSLSSVQASASAAATSATNAASSASSAQSAASSASSSATSATNSATAAATSASNASSSATSAANSASAASTSATNSASSANAAANSASAAANSATNAASSATAAANSATQAAGYAATLNLPSGAGNGGKVLRQKTDATGLEYINSHLSYGLGGNAPTASDLNAATTGGMWRIQSTSTANRPFDYGYCLVLGTGTEVMQLAMDVTTGNLYSRKLQISAGWSAWVSIRSAANSNVPQDFGLGASSLPSYSGDLNSAPDGTRYFMGSSFTNAPAGSASWFLIQQIQHNSVWKTQIAIGFAGLDYKIFYRQLVNGAWSGWLEYITSANLWNYLAITGVGSLGSYALMGMTGGVAGAGVDPGFTYPGSNLVYSNIAANRNGSNVTAAGTWRAMYRPYQANDTGNGGVGLWLRIA